MTIRRPLVTIDGRLAQLPAGDSLPVDSRYATARVDNTTAIADPGPTDDADAGYSVRSKWINTATGNIFVCLDATVGAAVWRDTTLTLADLGSAATYNTGPDSGLDADTVDGLQGNELATQLQLRAASPFNTDPDTTGDLFVRSTNDNVPLTGYTWHITTIISASGRVQLAAPVNGRPRLYYRNYYNGAWDNWTKVWDERNSTVDSNGFLKAASPIVKLYLDRIEKNGDFPATLEKQAVGHYVIGNNHGLARDGWQIETPLDANKQILIYAEVVDLDDATIEVKTYTPVFDGATVRAGQPVDIPEGRWIDLRLQAPPTEPANNEVQP